MMEFCWATRTLTAIKSPAHAIGMNSHEEVAPSPLLPLFVRRSIARLRPFTQPVDVFLSGRALI